MLSTILLSMLVATLLGLMVMQHWWNQQSLTLLLEQQSQVLKTQQQEHHKSIKTLTDLNAKAQALVASRTMTLPMRLNLRELPLGTPTLQQEMT